MASARRWYVYLVCFISLQLVAWAAIGLASNLLLVSGFGLIQAVLPQIALLIVATPVFAIHWFWAQRLAGREPEERASGIRQFYLYATLATLVASAAFHAYSLAATGLQLILKETGPDYYNSYNATTPGQTMMHELVVLAGLSLLWLYHWTIASGDSRALRDNESQATLRRLYVLLLSATGATMAFLGAIHLLRWVLYQVGGASDLLGTPGPLSAPLALLVVGLLLWLPYWIWAQRLFASGDEAERGSALRKFYLYAFIFAGVLGTVGNATLILAGVFRSVLSLPSQGDIRGPLPIIVVMGLMWAYHAYVLRADEKQTGEAPRQAGIRRLYQYLVAGVGLAALLVGLGGVISAVLQSLGDSGFGSGPRELLALSAAGVLAGLPVWLWPWWQIQRATMPAGAAANDERRSLVRRIYLYVFIFAATMAVLGNAVYLVYRILSQVFGINSSGNLLVDVGQSIAFTLIGVAVWVFHGLLIRADGRGNRRERSARLAGLEVVVLDGGEDGFGAALMAGLQRELPEVKAAVLDARALVADPEALASASPKLAAPGLIIMSWSYGDLTAEAAGPLARVVSSSPAQKLLVPNRLKGWDWAGVEAWTAPALVNHTLQAIKQWAEGAEVKFSRPVGLGAILGWIGIVLLLLEVVRFLVPLAFSSGLRF